MRLFSASTCHLDPMLSSDMRRQQIPRIQPLYETPERETGSNDNSSRDQAGGKHPATRKSTDHR